MEYEFNWKKSSLWGVSSTAFDPNYYGNATQVKESEVCYLAIVYDDQEPKLDPKEVSRGHWVGSETLRREAGDFARKYVVAEDNDSVNITKTERDVRLLSPWFIKAQQTFPEEIYEYRPLIP